MNVAGATESGGVWEAVDELLARYDAAINLEYVSTGMWTGQLRLTLTNPRTAPARSIAFYTTGWNEPLEVAVALLEDCARWLRESGVQPMAVPAWMTHDDEGAA